MSWKNKGSSPTESVCRNRNSSPRDIAGSLYEDLDQIWLSSEWFSITRAPDRIRSHDKAQYGDTKSHSYAGHGDNDDYYGYLKPCWVCNKKKSVRACVASCDRYGGVVIVDWRASSRPGSQRWHHFSRNPLQRCLGGPEGKEREHKKRDALAAVRRLGILPRDLFGLPLRETFRWVRLRRSAASSEPLASVQVPLT